MQLLQHEVEELLQVHTEEWKLTGLVVGSSLRLMIFEASTRTLPSCRSSLASGGCTCQVRYKRHGLLCNSCSKACRPPAKLQLANADRFNFHLLAGTPCFGNTLGTFAFCAGGWLNSTLGDAYI